MWGRFGPSGAGDGGRVKKRVRHFSLREGMMYVDDYKLREKNKDVVKTLEEKAA